MSLRKEILVLEARPPLKMLGRGQERGCEWWGGIFLAPRLTIENRFHADSAGGACQREQTWRGHLGQPIFTTPDLFSPLPDPLIPHLPPPPLLLRGSLQGGLLGTDPSLSGSPSPPWGLQGAVRNSRRSGYEAVVKLGPELCANRGPHSHPTQQDSPPSPACLLQPWGALDHSSWKLLRPACLIPQG